MHKRNINSNKKICNLTGTLWDQLAILHKAVLTIKLLKQEFIVSR